MASSKHRQQPQRVTQGRHQRTLPILTTEDKVRAKVEARAKADDRVRALEAENAQFRRDGEFHTLDKSCEEILKLNIQARKLTPQEVHRLANELNGAMARHKAKGLPAKSFDPYAVINADAQRHGKAVPLPAKDASPLDAQLPPPASAARVLPNDRAAHDASLSAYQERSAKHREREIKDRERYNARLRELGLTPPDVGMPGNGNGIGL